MDSRFNKVSGWNGQDVSIHVGIISLNGGMANYIRKAKTHYNALKCRDKPKMLERPTMPMYISFILFNRNN